MAVISGDKVVYERAFGVANVETKAPVTVDALFRISSNTKVFTAAPLLMLADEGKLSLQAPIGEYIRGLSPALSRVTPHQILTHTAGLSDDLSVPGLHDASALTAYVRSWKDDFIFLSPDRVFSYSSPGFALAGAMVEELGGRPYSEHIMDRLLKPLGMVRSTFDPTTAMTFPFSQGHHPSVSGTPAVVRPYPDNAARWPTGYMLSNVGDLGRFARAFMNGGNLDGRQVIPAAIVGRLGQAYVDVPNRSDGAKYGYGMYVSTYRGHRVVWHGGDSQGFGSLIRIMPERRVAVICLWNLTGGSSGFVEVSDKIMDVVLRTAANPAASGTNARQAVPGATPFAAMVGVYSNPHLGSVTLSLKGDTLVFAAQAFDSRFHYLTGERLPLTPISSDRFSMRPAGARNPITVQILSGADLRPELLHFSSRAFKKGQ